MKKEYRSVARTKETIRKAFVELISEKKNMDKITVLELVNRANISKSTFYNHYEDIYEVAEEFENELISKISAILDEINIEKPHEYDMYFKMVIEFIKSNEKLYSKVISSPDIRFFIDKLKTILSKKIFEEIRSLSFSKNDNELYVQIRFLTNACVDTMVDYFKGTLTVSLDELGEIILENVKKLKK